MGPRLARTCEEQTDGLGAPELLRVGVGIGKRKRRNREVDLARVAEYLAARRQDVHARGEGQDALRNVSTCLSDVFAVVEYEQELLPAQMPYEGLFQGGVGRLLAHAECGCKPAWDEGCLGDGREVAEPRPVGEDGERLPCRLEGEPGLAGPADTRQGH